jgi:hypothetical protein
MLVVGFDWRRRKQYGTALEFVLVLGSFIGLHEWTSLSLVRIQKIQTQSGMKLFSTIFSQNVSSKIISKYLLFVNFVAMTYWEEKKWAANIEIPFSAAAQTISLFPCFLPIFFYSFFTKILSLSLSPIFSAATFFTLHLNKKEVPNIYTYFFYFLFFKSWLSMYIIENIKFVGLLHRHIAGYF